MIRAVIFDMGGVILRTVDHAPRERMADRFGCTRKELEDFIFHSPTSVQSEIGQLSDMDHWRAVLDQFGQPDETPIDAYHEFFSGDAINQDLLNYARSLKEENKIGLLSNAWENARQRLDELFDFIDVFDGSLFSSEVGSRKPEEKIFFLMLERLGVEADQAVFIDDFAINVHGAESAGLYGVHFRDNSQAIEAVNHYIAAG